MLYIVLYSGQLHSNTFCHHYKMECPLYSAGCWEWFWTQPVLIKTCVCAPWLVSKMLTFFVNLELWCPPPWRRPPSRHSLPVGSQITPQYERLQGIMGRVVQERISTSYTSNAFTGLLQWRPPERQECSCQHDTRLLWFPWEIFHQHQLRVIDEIKNSLVSLLTWCQYV